MKNRTCALFVFDGFADWEPSLVTAGLNNFSDLSVKTFSLTGQPVISAGGLEINPHTSLEEIRAMDIDLLLLPGGEAWERGENLEIIPVVRQVIENKKKIAAICAATTLLGNLGLLDTIPHTSNSVEYLKQYCAAYEGEEYYQTEPCIAAENIITANGAAMVEFAYEILKIYSLLDDGTLEAWQQLYKSGGMIIKLFA